MEKPCIHLQLGFLKALLTANDFMALIMFILGNTMNWNLETCLDNLDKSEMMWIGNFLRSLGT